MGRPLPTSGRDILPFLLTDNIYDCEENHLEDLQNLIIDEIIGNRAAVERLRNERDRLREQLDILIAGQAGMWGTIAAKKSKEAREAEAECARMRDALTTARDAIVRADPTVLVDTLWMPMDVSPAETVVDFIDAALGATPKVGDKP